MTRRWFLGHGLLLLFGAAALLLCFENTDLDRLLARPFYDPALGDFPLRQHWLFAPVVYYGLKFAVLVGAVLAAAACLVGLSGNLTWLPRRNAALALHGASSGLPSGLCAGLSGKRRTRSSSPYSITRSSFSCTTLGSC